MSSSSQPWKKFYPSTPSDSQYLIPKSKKGDDDRVEVEFRDLVDEYIMRKWTTSDEKVDEDSRGSSITPESSRSSKSVKSEDAKSSFFTASWKTDYRDLTSFVASINEFFDKAPDVGEQLSLIIKIKHNWSLSSALKSKVFNYKLSSR